jgi:tripartite ATP-independent transporter DctP family solute receptor
MSNRIPALLGGALLAASLLSGCMKSETPPPKAAAPAPAAAPAAPQIVIKFAVGGPDTLPIFRAVKDYFKPQIEAKSNGRIVVELYPGSQLGDDVKLLESLRSGTLEAAGPTSAPLVGIVPQMAIFDIPFLFRNTKVADFILDGKIGQDLTAKLEEKGLYNLAWSEMGFRYLTNGVREIKTPKDIKGLKLRTMENPIHLATWRLLGANPTPMPVSEVFTALKQQAIDGQENPVVAISGWKFYEVNKYITLTGHVYSTLSFLYSKKIFDTYAKEDQALIRQIAKETGIKGREIARNDEAKYIEDIKKTGLATFTELTADQKKAFQTATASVWDLVTEKAGPELIKELKAEIAKAPD